MRAAAFACRLLVTALLHVPMLSVAGEQPLTVVTEEFPPYDFTAADGQVQGLSADVVRAVLTDLGMNSTITVLPWARAYKMALEKPNTLLFSVVRTPEREPLFHWLGVVGDVRSYLYKLRARADIKARELTDLHPYSVGVVRGWAGEGYLRSRSFPTLEAVADSDLNIKKLVNGRVDLIEDYEANVLHRMQRLGFDPGLLERVYFNEEISGPLYAVFNTGTDEGTVRRFTEAFAALHADGRYNLIQRRWLDPD